MNKERALELSYSDDCRIKIYSIETGKLSDKRVEKMSHDRNVDVVVASIKSGQLPWKRVEKLSRTKDKNILFCAIESGQLPVKRLEEILAKNKNIDIKKAALAELSRKTRLYYTHIREGSVIRTKLKLPTTSIKLTKN